MKRPASGSASVRFRALLGLLLGAAGAFALAASPTPRPTPTQTPRPRLSGGFGRTPVPSATRSEGEPTPVAAVRKEKDGNHGAPVAITNESLVKDPNKGRLSTSQIRPPLPTPAHGPAGRHAEPPAAAATAPAPVPVPAAAAAASAAEGGDEATWRERARTARRRVEELKIEITQLESDSKQLETDFYRWDDGQYRDRVIKPAWDKKREELETRRRQLVDAEADLADLPEKARKAGALPGWIRE